MIKIDEMGEWEEGVATPLVSDEDIAEVVAMWTGIPAAQIASEESARLLQDGEAPCARR